MKNSNSQKHNMLLLLSNEEYRSMIKAFSLGTLIYILIGDMVDPTYKKLHAQLEIIEGKLLERSEVFDFHEDEIFEDKKCIDLDSDFYEEVSDDLEEYEEFSLNDNLSRKLAMRDFELKYSPEEIQKMEEKYHGYLGVPLYDFEKKYWDEIEKHGYRRLVIDDKR